MTGRSTCKPSADIVRFLLRVAFVAALGIKPAVADNWADTAGDDKEYAETKAICVRAKSTKLPPVGAGAPEGCDSSALLYGADRPPDPAAARACAAREMTKSDSPPTGGAGTLATIYANGTGVPRDYDIAIAYACTVDGAPAEMDGRIKHLARLKANGPDKTPFDFCDDITSGMMTGFCAEREGALADAKRKVELDKLVAGLSAPGKTAFATLQAAQQAFAKSSSDNEVDVSGTGRAAFIIENKSAHDDAFLATMRAVLAGKVAAADASGADKRLNAAYEKIMRLKDVSGLGTVTKAGVKQAQRTWLRYRDAFVTFAKITAPNLSPDVVVADLTQTRARELRRMSRD